MLTEDRIRELIHREIDGELTSAENAELQSHLKSNRNYRDIRESLLNADAAIAGLPELDPPGELKTAIMQQISPRPILAPQRRNRAAELYRSIIQQFHIRPAIPFALGTLAGIALIMIFAGSSDIFNGPGGQQYSASLVHPAHETPPAISRQFTLSDAGGTVTATPSNGITWVDLHAIAAGSASIELSYDPAGLCLRAMNQQDLRDVTMTREEGIIKLDQRGESILSLGFSVASADAATLRIAITSGDEQYVDSIDLGHAPGHSPSPQKAGTKVR